MNVKNVDRRLTLPNVHEKDLILDVGGGLGLDALIISYFKLANYCVVVDVSFLPLKMGKVLSKRLKIKDKVDYICADAKFLPFRDKTYDMVTSFLAIEHEHIKKEYQRWINEMARVLKVGGFFIITFSNRKWIFYPLAKLHSYFVKKYFKTFTEHFFERSEIEAQLIKNKVSIKSFDGGVVYFRSYSPIPLSISFLVLKFNEKLESLASILEWKFLIIRKVCGRIGLVGVKEK